MGMGEMSGRWRSKHWQSSGGDDQQQLQIRGAAPSRESRRDNSRDRRPLRAPGTDTGASRRSSDQDYYDDRARWGGSGRHDGGHRRGEPQDSERWRRGMPIPDKGVTAVDKHAGDGSGDSSRPRSAGRVRATFPAAPAQAWGNPHQPGNVHLTESRAMEQKDNEPIGQAAASLSKRGWAKPEPGTSKTVNVWGADGIIKPGPSNKPIEPNKNTKPAIQIMKRSAESGARVSNPWATATPASIQLPTNAFPPVNSSKTQTVPTTVHEQRTDHVLPSTSSWGGKPKIVSVGSTMPTRRRKAEDFPSLSTSLTAPKTIQRHSFGLTAKDSQPIEGGGKKTKNGPGSNKKATTANLASFLSPPTKEHKKNKSQSKPKKTSFSTTALLGKKRSAPPQEDVLKLSDFNGTKKGRQRVNPRKKKLTTLKKKVLKERLRVWQERNNISPEDGPSAKRARCDGDPVSPLPKDDGSNSSTTLMLMNYIRIDEDDLDDEEEFDEITSNLISLTGRIGTVVSVYIPRPSVRSDSAATATDDGLSELEGKNVGLAFARYVRPQDADAARSVLDGIVVGGQTVSVSVLNVDTVGSSASSEENDRMWRLAALRAAESSVRQSVVADHSNSNLGGVSAALDDGSYTIAFRGILCDDDYEDDDALHESVEDLKSLVRQYAVVTKGHGTVTGPDKGNVYISVCDGSSADEAVKRLNGMIVGGNAVTVELVGQDDLAGDAEIVIENVLNDDDFADADCLEETVADLKALAAKFGMVGRTKAETEGEMKGKVFVTFTEGQKAAKQAAAELDGMLIGGQIISAKVVAQSSSKSPLSASRHVEDPPPPMYSGDKIIPESFAECKRVPKIPNKGSSPQTVSPTFRMLCADFVFRYT